MLTIRCSSLPRLCACAASAVKPTTRIEPARQPADLGTAFHECMKRVALDQAFDVSDIADEHNVPVDDLAPMAGWGAKIWRERLSPMFPVPEVERQLEFVDASDDMTLTGRPDIYCVTDGEIRVLDWKTGWLDTDATEQLKGYGLLTPYASQARLPVRLTTLRVRDQRATTVYWTPEMLDAWWHWLKRHLQDVDIYRPGEHCGRCPRALECPAHRQYLAAGIAVINERDGLSANALEELAASLPIDQLVETLAQSKQIASFCDRWQKAVKAHVIVSGGVKGPLHIKETHPREISVDRGQEVLIDVLGTQTLLELVEVGTGKLEKAIKSKATPRGGAALVRDTFARLEAAGAITTTTSTRLEINRNGDSNQTAITANVTAENAG